MKGFGSMISFGVKGGLEAGKKTNGQRKTLYVGSFFGWG
jgi:O-acetylhomoserine/O-acetylserine sulfhydrylase-like pyridoxal-dependent enzyme